MKRLRRRKRPFETEEIQSEPEAIQDYKLPPAEPNPDKIPANNSDQIETPEEVVNEYGILPAAEPNPDKIHANDSDQFETLEEVVNEYGIFEEKGSKEGGT
jgi:hypothetical protein